ncbi:MAG: aminopeptidase P family protein [Phycisphaerales bacterium]|nr:aminopeptidase P family protein [Phycisphaerales bacterium]MCI0631680.1 aminopeptidase P family protein [Phycisphaerales bacterium]
MQFDQSVANSPPAFRHAIRRIEPGMTIAEVEEVLRTKGIAAAGTARWSFYSFNLAIPTRSSLDAIFTYDWRDLSQFPVVRFERWYRDPFTGKRIDG